MATDAQTRVRVITRDIQPYEWDFVDTDGPPVVTGQGDYTHEYTPDPLNVPGFLMGLAFGVAAGFWVGMTIVGLTA